MAFLGGTPGHQRYEIVKELRQKVAKLKFPKRGPDRDKRWMMVYLSSAKLIFVLPAKQVDNLGSLLHHLFMYLSVGPSCFQQIYQQETHSLEQSSVAYLLPLHTFSKLPLVSKFSPLEAYLLYIIPTEQILKWIYRCRLTVAWLTKVCGACYFHSFRWIAVKLGI